MTNFRDKHKKTISKYFSFSEENINKVCDAVIFTKLNHQDYIFFCELKSEKPKEKDYMIQYQNSTLFIYYLIKVLNSFYLLNYPIKPTKKYILFDTKKQEVKRNLNRDMKTEKTLISPENKEFNGLQRPVYMIHRQSFRDNNSADIIMSINSLSKNVTKTDSPNLDDTSPTKLQLVHYFPSLASYHHCPTKYP